MVTWSDGLGDILIRRPDSGADGPIDPQIHRVVDILSYSLGRWWCRLPDTDPFVGGWSWSGEFVRLDIRFIGLINPPGPPGCCGYGFDPFAYGPHPVYLIVEFDVDANDQTGGEVDAPDLRYLGNVARFGGLPTQPWWRQRTAQGLSSFDGNLATPPHVERSGEDFHLSLFGWDFQVVSRSDPSDYLFGAGETWILRGKMFHRAFAYERFSLACCMGKPGSYEPEVQVQFSHNPVTDVTTVSWVYPLTNAGSADMRGEPFVEPDDGNTFNQNSIHEGLEDLVYSTARATPEMKSHPQYALISDWEGASPEAWLDPTQWRLNLLAGMAYTEPQMDAVFVYTDTAPGVVMGDFNGNGWVNSTDFQMLIAHIAARDGVPGEDADGLINGRITLHNFGPNFSVYDLNYDGVVSLGDWEFAMSDNRSPADMDRDRDVDLDDWGQVQRCIGWPVNPELSPDCAKADLDRNGMVNGNDLVRLRSCMEGADIVVDPMCAR